MAADRVLSAHDALKAIFATEQSSEEHEKHRRLFLELLPPSSGRGRQEKRPGEELLPPHAPSLAGLATVAKIFHQPWTDVRAACMRRARKAADPSAASKRPNHAVGTREERRTLATFVDTMAREHMAQPRDAVAAMMREMLAHRRQMVQAASTLPAGQPSGHNLSPPPLTTAELDFLEGRRALSTGWFIRWEEEEGVKSISKAALQSEKRATAFTKTACVEHFRDLDSALSKLGFLITSGRYKNYIKREGKFIGASVHCCCVHHHSRPPSFPAVLDQIITVDEVPGLKIGVTGRVYGQANATQDSAVVAEQEHNISSTLVWAFSMRGVAVPPVIIEKLGKQSQGRQTRSACKPHHFFKDYPWAVWAASETGFINTRIFLDWARMLRQYLGHVRPVLLLSDGHATRTRLDVVNELHRLNIHLFLIPPNTSHALAASDQFHQHIHRRRFILERQLRIETNGALHREDKIECLLKAATESTALCGLMRTAFTHAGIGREQRSIALLRNKPAPDPQPSAKAAAPLSRHASAESEASSTLTPSTSQESTLSPRSVRRAMRHLKKSNQKLKQVVKAMLESTPDAAVARARDLREQREQRRANRSSVRLQGLLTTDEACAELKKRSKAVAARNRAKEKAGRGRSLGKKIRKALGREEGAEDRRPLKAELVDYLETNGIAFPQRAKYAELTKLVRGHLEEGASEASGSGDDDSASEEASSAFEEEEQDLDDDDDTVVLTHVAPMGNLTLGPNSSTPAAASTCLPASHESASFSDDAIAQTEATLGDDDANTDNASPFLSAPSSQYMHDLILKCSASIIAMREHCMEIAAAEDKKEERDRKKDPSK